MSTLSVYNLQGFSTYSNTVRIPGGNTFQIDGDLKIPVGTTAQRPASPVEGHLRYNTTLTRLEIYANGGWNSVLNTGQDGTTAARAVDYSMAIREVNPDAQPGWYWININGTAQQFWVDTLHDGGGWVLVMQNRINTGSIGAVPYATAINYAPTANGNYGTGYTPASFNLWVGLNAWSWIVNKNQLYGKLPAGMLKQFVATSYVNLNAVGGHTKRMSWRWGGAWGSAYAWTGQSQPVIEAGGSLSGFWSYHISNGYNLTTYDNDQDAYSSNCSTSYGNHPFWFGACWSGNMWGSTTGSHQAASYWDSSVSDYHNYGALYLR